MKAKEEKCDPYQTPNWKEVFLLPKWVIMDALIPHSTQYAFFQDYIDPLYGNNVLFKMSQ